MKASIKLITIKGISVYLHFTLLLFLAWIVIMNIAAGMQWMQLAWSVSFILAVFACIVMHEYGHAFVAAYYGINAKKITLYPIGGIASIEKLPENQRQELLISAAGPAVSFIIAAGCWLLASQDTLTTSLKNYTGTINAYNFLSLLGTVNLLLALFNLIPAFPMDGGRILRALLAFRFNYLKATTIAAAVGKIIAALFILYGLTTMNFMLFIIGLFIILFAQAEESYLQLKQLVKGLYLKDMVMYDYNSLDANQKVNEAASLLEHNHSRYFIVMDKGMPVGTINRMEIMKAIAEQQYDQKLDSLMKNSFVSLQGDADAESALQTLSSNEEKLFPVLDKGKFIGVINFQHLIEYLLLHKTRSKDFVKTKSLVHLV